jgi:hypothetical protein
VGLIALRWWLVRYDVGRRTVRQRGVTRFMAVCLLGGYAWLGVGGAIAAVAGVAMPGAVALLLFMFSTGRSMALTGNHGDSI